MNLLQLKALIRSMLKRRFLSAVQIAGLVTGFGIVFFLFAKIGYEYSYDKFWNNYRSVYRVALDLKHSDGRSIISAKNFHGSSELLDEELPGIVAHCNMAPDKITVYDRGKMIQDVDWFWSDTTFFSVFERKILYRESAQLFGDIHGVVVSESFARKLFGDENPLNREIRLNEGWRFLVKAVFEDLPANSHLKVDVLGSYQSLSYYSRNFDNRAQVLIENPTYNYSKASPYMGNRWRSATQHRPYCYIRLDENTRIAEVEAAVAPALSKVAFPDDLADSKMNFIFQPLASIHLHSNLDGELRASGSAMQVNFLIVICLVVMLVCFVNYLNLSTISTLEDRKSYAVRLINGSGRSHILFNLLLHNLLLFFASLVLAFPLAVLLVNRQLPDATISGNIITYVGLGALTGAMLTSLIPFVSVFRQQAHLLMKGIGQNAGASWSGRKVLVVVQFAITIVLLISTVGIYKQMQFVMKEQLGFSGGQTIFSYTPMSMTNHPDIPLKLATFRDEALALPGVRSFSASSSVPGRAINRRLENVMLSGSNEPFAAAFGQVSIDDQFPAAYDLKLLAGEGLRQQSNWLSDEVLLNHSAARVMGFAYPADAVGSVFSVGGHLFTIRGVIADYHHVSLHFPIQPIIYFQNLDWELSVGYYSFCIDAANAGAVAHDLSRIWEKLYPMDEFIYFFSDREFESQYRSDLSFNRILTFSALMALLISCLGLLSLAMFNTNLRVKEIGIRKVNGAKISEILAMLNRDFVKWVVVAFVIATPVAWYAMHKWLENFAYKTELSWWIFALAGLLALGIALLTVSWQSWKAATRNPVEALRYE
ncbi:ABC transporter permease [Gaoshiqia sp. Z1-71]|uniref:ABC transporter permease n=1 Tax=Gaoshiqia hydrogeniformans TaxID=3290090 RepID=UPI003BF8307D